MTLLLLAYPLVCLLLGTVSGSASWLREAVMHALVVIALGAALVFALRRERWPSIGGLFEPALALLFLVLLASSLQSPCAGRSWRMVLLMAAATGIFYMVIGRGGDLGALHWIVPATGAAAAAIGLAAYAWRWTPRVAVPLGHHNYMAGFLLLHLPLTWAAAAAARHRLVRLFWLAAVVMEVLAILLTGSLAGIVVLVGMALLLAVGRISAPANRGEAQPEGRATERAAVRPYAAVALLLIVAAAALWFRGSRSPVIGALRQRISGIAAEGHDPSLSLENRMRFLRAGLAMGAARPLVGFGPAAVPFAASLYREQVPGVMPPGEVVPQLHDLPVNLLAETGILGLAAAVLLVLTALGGRTGPAAVAVWAYLAFSLSDYQLDLPAILFPLALIGAVAAGRDQTPEEPGNLPRWTGVAALLLAILGGALVLGFSSAAQYYYQHGNFARAAEWDAHCGFYDFQSGARAEAAGQASQAREFYLSAARRMPNVIPVAAQAGSSLAAAGEYTQSLPWLERAAALDYYFTLAHFHLGQARLAQSDRAGAIDAFSTSLLVQPATVLAEDWRTPPQRDLYAESLERALDKLHELAALYPQSGPWRRWNELGAFLIGRRNLLPDGQYRVLFFELLDRDLAMSQSLIVFRRAGLPMRVAPVVLRATTPNPLAPAGLGVIQHLPSTRAVDRLSEVQGSTFKVQGFDVER